MNAALDSVRRDPLVQAVLERFPGAEIVDVRVPDRDGAAEDGVRGMRVIVCGGRDFRNAAFVYTTLDQIHAETPITALMQGGAAGADSLAKEWARTKPGIQRYVCRADWESHGRAAGPIRNKRMLEWMPDLVVAFPGGAGTADMVRQASEAGVEVRKVGW